MFIRLLTRVVVGLILTMWVLAAEVATPTAGSFKQIAYIAIANTAIAYVLVETLGDIISIL